ncbi:hypothetical protein Tco_0522451 [Tanacetum coccineum]
MKNTGQQHTEQPEIINEGRVDQKLKGNNVDTKFAKTSVLGKPVLQSLRNQSVVRQLNAFKFERPQLSKQRFASQVDVNNNLSRPVTQHYLPKRKESAFAKPDHMIASSSSRNMFIVEGNGAQIVVLQMTWFIITYLDEAEWKKYTIKSIGNTRN